MNRSVLVSDLISDCDIRVIRYSRKTMHIQTICIAKGQLISKCLFCIINSPKKRTKKFDFTTMVPQVEQFLFVFGRNEDTKKIFRN